MEKKRNIQEVEMEEKKKLFKKSVELCQQVFGNIAFRRYYIYENEEGKTDKKINEGLMDVQLYGFREYEKREIAGKEQVIRDAFIDLITTEKKMIESIEKGTYGTPQVKLRTEKWLNKLREVIGYHKDDRRLYTSEEKELLFKRANGICQLCKNKIYLIDDAHVDHIERVREGGKTTIKNGQITHRYCNLHKN
ncbi:MAG: HNH endonuclease signature motif containing protein [Candidatus Pacearchaeota archaeon]|nr:HNH endonuclease signature motif containing protein [Candidatus Pacearchaeota archaeon]